MRFACFHSLYDIVILAHDYYGGKTTTKNELCQRKRNFLKKKRNA